MINAKAAIGLFALLLASASMGQTFGATKPIWQQRSLYRNIIVLEGNGHRCLTFGKRSARQSCIETDQPDKLVFGYTQRMFEALQHINSIRRVLVIGIGGGSLPMAIHHRFPEAHIDAVELDPEVVRVAERYFKFKPDEKLNVFAEDGRVFIRKAIKDNIRYDAILLDAFDKDYIPEHMATSEFLKQVKTALNPDGLLLANTYAGTGYQKHEEATYQSVFEVIHESKIPNGNRIILAGKDAARISGRLPDSGEIKPSDALVMTDRYAPVNTLLIH